MRFTSKRAETENSTEAGTSKLMVGLVDKRKPGMEFLGKRSGHTYLYSAFLKGAQGLLNC